MPGGGYIKVDASVVRSNYQREAYAFEVQGMNHAAQAALYDTKVKSSMLDTYLKAGGSILGAAGSAFGAGKISNGIGLMRAFG